MMKALMESPKQLLYALFAIGCVAVWKTLQERAAASDLALMQKFWKDREGSGGVVEAWSIDNPLRTWKFNERRKELQQQLGRTPDELEGLHGSDPNNYISIVP